MSTITPRTGFVGFFDILGYKQIILNNDIHKTAQIISDTLMNIPETVITNLTHASQGEWVNESAIDPWQKTLEQIDWLIFSDSILISLPFDPSLPLNDLLKHYAAFVTVCATLMNKTFEAGLPLRGAISVGEFFIEDKCFAGKPIINAYRTAQDLEFSGCILEEDANTFISALRKDLVREGGSNMLTMLDQTTILYMVPVKTGNPQRHRAINWVSLGLDSFPQLNCSIRDYVTSAFIRHNKIALPDVLPKINNTEMFVRHVLTNLEIKPWSLK